MSQATIEQSSRTLTNNIYEKNINGDNNDNILEKDALTMDEYHLMVYQQQMEDYLKNKKEIEDDANQRMTDHRKLEDKIKIRNQKAKELYKKYTELTTDPDLKNHWYWKHYFGDTQGTYYTDIDKYLDDLDDKNFKPVPLSDDDKLKKINGDFLPYERHITKEKATPFKYQFPHFKASYDIYNDRFLLNKKHTNNKETKETNNKETKETENFNNIDPKLLQIYNKAMGYDNDNQNYSYTTDDIYGYIYFLAVVVFLGMYFMSYSL